MHSFQVKICFNWIGSVFVVGTIMEPIQQYNILLHASSVTRLCIFWMFLATNILTKAAQIKCWLFGLFLQTSCWGYILGNGCFYYTEEGHTEEGEWLLTIWKAHHNSFSRNLHALLTIVCTYLKENYAEILPVHYAWKVPEKGFKIS